MTHPFNPYAAPQAAPPAYGGLVAPGQPVSWEPGEVIQLAASRFNRAWLVLVVGYFMELVISQAVSSGPVLVLRLVSPGADKTLVGVLVQVVSTLAGVAIGAFFAVGLLRVGLDAARGRAPRFGTLFLGGDRFLAMIGLYVVMWLPVAIGFLLLIVPGVILALGLCLAPFFLVDANMGPFEAMRASWAATNGQKGKLFGLAMLSLGITLLGLLACGIGIVPASSLLYLAWAIAYTRVSGRDPALLDATGR